jgi:hypothetical protein
MRFGCRLIRDSYKWENKESEMDMKEFFTTLAERQGITIEPERAEEMAGSGGVVDMISGMRERLFSLDVSGHRPLEAPEFEWEEDES